MREVSSSQVCEVGQGLGLVESNESLTRDREDEGNVELELHYRRSVGGAGGQDRGVVENRHSKIGRGRGGQVSSP